jgi:hypothetical protein
MPNPFSEPKMARLAKISVELVQTLSDGLLCPERNPTAAEQLISNENVAKEC